MKWAETDQRGCLFQAWHAPSHILEPVAVRFAIGDVMDLRLAAEQIHDRLGEFIDCDLILAPKISHLPETGRGSEHLHQTRYYVVYVTEAPALLAVAVNHQWMTS